MSNYYAYFVMLDAEHLVTDLLPHSFCPVRSFVFFSFSGSARLLLFTSFCTFLINIYNEHLRGTWMLHILEVTIHTLNLLNITLAAKLLKINCKSRGANESLR